MHQETRAKLILAGLGAAHTAGLVVGERDLSLGLPFLTAAAAEAKVPLLSANLRDANGKALFEGHAVVSAGGLKLCAVAIRKPTDIRRGSTRRTRWTRPARSCRSCPPRAAT